MAGEHVCTAIAKTGALVLSLSDPSHPREISTFAGEDDHVRCIACDGQLMLVTARRQSGLDLANRLQVVSVSDPAQPAVVSTLDLSLSLK